MCKNSISGGDSDQMKHLLPSSSLAPHQRQLTLLPLERQHYQRYPPTHNIAKNDIFLSFPCCFISFAFGHLHKFIKEFINLHSHLFVSYSSFDQSIHIMTCQIAKALFIIWFRMQYDNLQLESTYWPLTMRSGCAQTSGCQIRRRMLIANFSSKPV